MIPTPSRFSRPAAFALTLLAAGALLACQPTAQAPATPAPASAPAGAATSAVSQAPGQPLYVARDYVGDGVFGHLIEGPMGAPDGSLYLVGYGPHAGLARVTAGADGQGKVAPFLDFPEGSMPNALKYTRGGMVYVADYTGHNVWRLDLATRQLAVYAHLDGASQPNDIAIAPDGTMYASDPDWKAGTGKLWKISAGGQARVIEAGMGTTNGIAVSPDGKHLYVNESVQRTIWVYDIAADGSVHDKRLFKHFDDAGLDGMRCDDQGNLYVARYGAGRVLVLTPTGQVAHVVELKGDKPTNVAFGGPDRRQVYVTMQARGAIETFRARYPGRAYPAPPKP